MGKSSEEHLQDYLKVLYPDEEHVAVRKQLKQENLIHQQLCREHLTLETKPIADCETLDSYLRDYDKKMAKLFDRMNTIRSYLKKNTRNYRGNPWH